MNCEETKHHLYDAALGEETSPELEQHLATCAACREELAALQTTRRLVAHGLTEEEPPRRLSFVADVPSVPPRPSLLRFWQWSFAGAMAMALLFGMFALWRPSAVPAPTTTATFTRAEVEQIVNAAVRQSEERQRAETAKVIETAAKRMGEQLQYYERTQSIVYKAAEQNRAELQQMASVIGRAQGGRP